MVYLEKIFDWKATTKKPLASEMIESYPGTKLLLRVNHEKLFEDCISHDTVKYIFVFSDKRPNKNDSFVFDGSYCLIRSLILLEEAYHKKNILNNKYVDVMYSAFATNTYTESLWALINDNTSPSDAFIRAANILTEGHII